MCNKLTYLIESKLKENFQQFIYQNVTPRQDRQAWAISYHKPEDIRDNI